MKIYNKIKLRLIKLFNPALYVEIQEKNKLKYKKVIIDCLKKRADEIFTNIINQNSLLDRMQRHKLFKK